jgi:mono/diheme cytochrome c family protein
MQIFRVTCLSFSLMLFLWGMPDIVLAQYNSVVTLGQQEFQSYCATCHGPKAKGDGPSASFLRIKPTDLTQLSKHNGGTFPFVRTYEQIDGSSRTVVAGHGTSDMPIWGAVFRGKRGSAEQWLLGTEGRIYHSCTIWNRFRKNRTADAARKEIHRGRLLPRRVESSDSIWPFLSIPRKGAFQRRSLGVTVRVIL